MDRDILILSEDGFVHVMPLDRRRNIGWNNFKVAAHDVGYDPSGDIIAISALDGGSWFYSISLARWSYQRDHDTEVWSGLFTPDANHFVSIDKTGFATIRSSLTLFD
jgi:hypothetical protein